MAPPFRGYEIDFSEIGADKHHVRFAKISDFTRPDPVRPHLLRANRRFDGGQPDTNHPYGREHHRAGNIRPGFCPAKDRDAVAQRSPMGECVRAGNSFPSGRQASTWTRSFPRRKRRVGRYGSEAGTRRYIAGQGSPDYQPLYEGQLSLFDETNETMIP